jgi:hypothetical protein
MFAPRSPLHQELGRVLIMRHVWCGLPDVGYDSDSYQILRRRKMTRCAINGSRLSHFRSIRSITRPARFAKDEIVAVILALPEPLAVLALMNGGVELRDREKLVTAHETSVVTEVDVIGKYIPDTARRAMAVLAFENQQWRLPAQNPLGAP